MASTCVSFWQTTSKCLHARTFSAPARKQRQKRPGKGAWHPQSLSLREAPAHGKLVPKLLIDNIEVEVPARTNLLQACTQAGVEIPHFCYHERLSVAGNCRMCLVELEGSSKLVASCAMPAMHGMKVKTCTPTVVRAREGVMEFLLINHPLDCPICDQGGECDLQDQAMAYGFDRSRFKENKRAIKDKYMGPLIRTIMTRCIHCTRCIRFASEVAGVETLGVLGRGENAEITSLEQAVDSPLSGNLVDICPVGALTSRPYAFRARPWELTHTNSVDVLDALGSAIRIDSRGQEVVRILPRLHEEINEEWIHDKTRYACDGLARQRLDRPYLRKHGKLKPVGWKEALGEAGARLEPGGCRIAAIAGDLCDVESVFSLRQLFSGLGSANLECRQDGAHIDPQCRSGYLFNSGIAGIEQVDALLLIGCDLRREAPLVDARVRKRFLRGGMRIARIGCADAESGYPVETLGETPAVLRAIALGDHPFVEQCRKVGKAAMILGMSALQRPDGAVLLSLARRAAEVLGMVDPTWNGFNLLQRAAGRVGALDVGFCSSPDRNVGDIFVDCREGRISTVFLLGADEFDMQQLGDAFVIYQGHHGDKGAHRADLILPGAAYSEKDALYVNMEGRVQEACKAVFPPGDAREDWKILRALCEHIGRKPVFSWIENGGWSSRFLASEVERFRGFVCREDLHGIV